MARNKNNVAGKKIEIKRRARSSLRTVVDLIINRDRFTAGLLRQVRNSPLLHVHCCNPAPLERRVEGDQLLIEKSAILAGRSYFNFANKKFGS